MSEAPRTYSGRLQQGRRRPQQGQGWRGTVVLVVLVALLLYGLWITRDNYPVDRLIPAKTACHITANELLANRQDVAASQVWSALPARLQSGDMRQAITQDLGMPEWVLNNLIPGSCYVAANDIAKFSDVLLISRMTRLGCLIERAYRHFPGVEEDWAGGLYLRRMRKSDLYYAVRGRILLASRSRENLITALTLRPEDTVKPEELAESARQNSDCQFWGSLALSPTDPLGNIFDSLLFKVKIEPAGAILYADGTLRPELQVRLDEKAQGLGPRPLMTPPDGILRASADFGIPMGDLWQLITTPKLQQWMAVESGDTKQSLASALAGLLRPLGPGACVAWRGIDTNNIFPVPDIVGVFDANAALATAWNSLPNSPQVQPLDFTLRYDPQTSRLHLPMISDSVGLVAAPFEKWLLAATSSPTAETFLTQAVAPQILPEQGNIYLEMRPAQCLQALEDAGCLMTEARLLQGQTPESVRQWAQPLIEQSTRVDSITLFAACNQGRVTAQVQLTCAK